MDGIIVRKNLRVAEGVGLDCGWYNCEKKTYV